MDLSNISIEKLVAELVRRGKANEDFLLEKWNTVRIHEKVFYVKINDRTVAYNNSYEIKGI